MTKRLDRDNAALLQIARQGPEWARAVADLVSLLEGGEIDTRPRHPLTGAPMEEPLSEMQMAALNHHRLSKMEVGRARLAEMDCDCEFCLHWRKETEK